MMYPCRLGQKGGWCLRFCSLFAGGRIQRRRHRTCVVLQRGSRSACCLPDFRSGGRRGKVGMARAVSHGTVQWSCVPAACAGTGPRRRAELPWSRAPGRGASLVGWEPESTAALFHEAGVERSVMCRVQERVHRAFTARHGGASGPYLHIRASGFVAWYCSMLLSRTRIVCWQAHGGALQQALATV